MEKKIIVYGTTTMPREKTEAEFFTVQCTPQSTSTSPASVLTNWQYIDVSSAALLCLLIGSHGSLTQLCHSDFMHLV